MVESFVLIATLALVLNGVYESAGGVLIIRAIGGSICNGIGNMALIHAVSIGKAGPASGISLIQTPLAVLLTAAIDGQATNYMELLSVALSVMGSLIIILGEDGVLKCLRRNSVD